MHRKYGTHWIRFSTSLLLALSMFAVDCFTERGMGDGAIYAVLMGMGLMFEQELYVGMLALALSGLSILGYYFSPVAGDEHNAVVGRVIAFGCIWVTAAIVYYKKRSDTRLLENEDRLRQAESAAKIGHYEINLDTHSFIWSDEIFRIVGLEPGSRQPSLMDFFRMIHSDDLETVSSTLRNSLQQLVPVDTIFRIVRADGDIRYIHHIASLGTAPHRPLERRFYGTVQDVTESQKVTEQVLQSEERFSRAFQSSPVVKIISTLEDFRIVDVNESFCRTFGYVPSDAIGKTTRALGLPAEPQEEAVIMNLMRTNRNIRNHEITGRTRDGHLRHLLLSTEIMLINGVEHLLFAMVDVTEKKAAEIELESVSSRFQSFAKMSPIGIFHTNNKGDLLFINDKLAHILGLTYVEALGRGWMNVLLPDDREDLKKEWTEAVKAMKPVSRTLPMRNKRTGQVPDIHIRANPIRNEDGQLQGFVGTIEDVTEQLQAQKIIAASEAWFRNMAENSPVMIWSSDADNVRNYFNGTWLQFTGRTAAQESASGWLKDVHPAELERCRKAQVEACQTRAPFETEYRLRRSDGSYRWILDRAKPVFSPSGECTGFIGSCADIHDRHTLHIQLEQLVKERTLELTQSLEKEKELSDMKSRFVSMASHEFRTPLSAVLSSVYLVDQYNAPEHEASRKKHIARIKSSVKNLVDILNEFLSLDKLEQGKVDISKEWFDLPEFVRDVAEEVKGLQRPGQFVTISQDGDHEILQDRKILKNILLNLLSNAVKYSGEGKEIELKVLADENGLQIEVRDHGIGIPREEQKHIFSKFFRARNTSNIQGTGLGLNIVHRYVELLGGTIAFNSEPEQGSSFLLHFPASLVEA